MQGGVWGGMCPLRSGRFLTFPDSNGAMWCILFINWIMQNVLLNYSFLYQRGMLRGCWRVAIRVGQYIFIVSTKCPPVIYNCFLGGVMVMLLLDDKIHRICSNSHPCPYKRPPTIFWSYKPYIINKLPWSIHKAYILSSIWLGISQNHHIWVDPSNK